MSKNRHREQGVLFTTLVDFLLQVVFLLVLLIYPVMSYIDRNDSMDLDRLYPEIKKFIPKFDEIDWQRLELALVPKEIASAYAAEPEKLAEDLREIMRKAGLDPDKATIADLKEALGELKDKADKYDKYVVGTPYCSLTSTASEPYTSKTTPLLNVQIVSEGFRIQAASAEADSFLKHRLGIALGNAWTAKSEPEFRALFDAVNELDSSCKHLVRVSDKTSKEFPKDEYKRRLSVISQYTNKWPRFNK